MRTHYIASLHETCLTTVLHARKHSPRHSLHPSRQSGQGAIAFHPSQVEIKLRSCWTPQQPAHSHPSCSHSTAVSPVLDSVSQAARWVFERDLQSASGSCRSLCQQQSSRHLRHWAELGRCSRPCDQLPSFAASKPGRPSSKQLWPVPDAGASVSARPFAPWRLAMQFRPMTAFLAWSQACHCSQLVCFFPHVPTHSRAGRLCWWLSVCFHTFQLIHSGHLLVHMKTRSQHSKHEQPSTTASAAANNVGSSQQPASSSRAATPPPSSRAVESYYNKKRHPGSPTKHNPRGQRQIDRVQDRITAHPDTYSRRALDIPRRQPLTWWFAPHNQVAAAEELHCLLPSMLQLAQPAADQVAHFSLFNPADTIHQNAVRLLKQLGDVLFPSAFHPCSSTTPQEELPPAFLAPLQQQGVDEWRCWPWFSPLVIDQAARVEKMRKLLAAQSKSSNSKQTPYQRPLDAPVYEPECMVASSSCVRMQGGMEQVSGGYVLVVLGSIKQADGSWTPVKEYGHRLVYWALLGPFQHDPQAWTGAAPEQQAGPVVMHTCHNKSCLQPLHLLLGNYSENNTRRALEEDEIGYRDAHRRRDTRAVELRAEQEQAEGLSLS